MTTQSDTNSTASTVAATTSKESAPLHFIDVRDAIHLVERSVVTGEQRFLTRAMRAAVALRRQGRLSGEVLSRAVLAHLPNDNPVRPLLLNVGKVLKQRSMDLDVPATVVANNSTKYVSSLALYEVEAYLSLLAVLLLVDAQQWQEVIQLSQTLVQRLQAANRRTLDVLLAKLFYYLALAHEQAREPLAGLRTLLLNALRSATLHHDTDCQATLINALLRHYLQENLFEQADKLVAKTTFPADASNNQVARYMYYMGRIQAIQLSYTTSHQHLLQAVRKAPATVATAGFQQAAQKLAVIVQLLMGEIPERSLFRTPVLRKALLPYFHLTQAVRIGDLQQFQETCSKYAQQFHHDKTWTLIQRLRHNVIKTGIRMISLSYSRIALSKVCEKLGLGSQEDAEFIIAKAIRDGVIDAVLDHEGAFMKSKENPDIYSTNEPQSVFDQRITFCLQIHNDAVKAMRFPAQQQKQSEEEAERARQEKELVKEIEQGSAMDEDDDMDF